MLIIGRVSGMFDRHRVDDQRYQFLDMFESSIGVVTNRESQLLDRFNRAAQLLQKNLREGSGIDRSAETSPGHGTSYHDDTDELLDIGVETSLLAETKDIRDELNIIAVVLETQMERLEEFESHITEELRSEGSRRATDAIVHEVRKRGKEQRRLLELHRRDLDRMDRQAEGLYLSITHLLDLKQKHSNALEARFARDQAVIAARQGQTIMALTIMTIAFLPLSFIASFFAINIEDWNGQLTLGYVSKYLFGIGLTISIPLIAIAFTAADIFDAFSAALVAMKPKIRDYITRKITGKKKPAGVRGGDEDEDSGDDIVVERKMDATGYTSSRGGARARGSTADDAGAGWKSGRGLDWLPPGSRDRGSYDRSRLSARLSGAARKYSGSSANAHSWTRPSLDKNRIRLSADLERGREGESSRDY
jgi:Mg2+ and Co2+ transporter CorA